MKATGFRRCPTRAKGTPLIAHTPDVHIQWSNALVRTREIFVRSLRLAAMHMRLFCPYPTQKRRIVDQMQPLDEPATEHESDDMAATRTTNKKTAKSSASAQKGRKAGGGKSNPTMDWLVAFMTKNPNAVYADAAAEAKKARHTIYPIMWGRAQVMLGRIKQKPRGSGKATQKSAAAKTAPAPAAAPRGPGRPPRARTPSAPRGGISIPVDEGAVETMSMLVAALNNGRRAVLRYDGSGWTLGIE